MDRRNLSNVLAVISVIVISLLFVVGLRGFVLNGTIPSESMVPTMKVNDKFMSFTTKFFNYGRGDIVVFKHDSSGSPEDGGFMIKRVIGLPGDTVVMEKGSVIVNGRELYEPYISEPAKHEGVFKVPENRYFLLGDNRNKSYDSSLWDIPYVHYEDILYVTKWKTVPVIDFSPEYIGGSH